MKHCLALVAGLVLLACNTKRDLAGYRERGFGPTGRQADRSLSVRAWSEREVCPPAN